jgi:hypothetical protein
VLTSRNQSNFIVNTHALSGYIPDPAKAHVAWLKN